MKSNQTTKILYWTFTLLFVSFFIMDGIVGILQVEEGKEIMRHLGYPVYVLIILGAAKLLGALAVLQNRFVILKEWAYAGFTFHFIGACASRAFVGDSFLLILSPIVFMGFMFANYFLWKRFFPQREINASVIAG